MISNINKCHRKLYYMKEKQYLITVVNKYILLICRKKYCIHEVIYMFSKCFFTYLRRIMVESDFY